MPSDQIVEYLKDATQFPLNTNPVTFHWPRDQLDNLLLLLRSLTNRKLFYDYPSERVQLDMTPESDLHFQIQNRLCRVLETDVEGLAATMTYPEICRRMKRVTSVGTVNIKQPGAWVMQADISFRELPKRLASLVCEIS